MAVIAESPVEIAAVAAPVSGNEWSHDGQPPEQTSAPCQGQEQLLIYMWGVTSSPATVGNDHWGKWDNLML